MKIHSHINPTQYPSHSEAATGGVQPEKTVSQERFERSVRDLRMSLTGVREFTKFMGTGILSIGPGAILAGAVLAGASLGEAGKDLKDVVSFGVQSLFEK